MQRNFVVTHLRNSRMPQPRPPPTSHFQQQSVHSPCSHDNFKQQISPVTSTWFPWNHFKQITSANHQILQQPHKGWTPTHMLHTSCIKMPRAYQYRWSIIFMRWYSMSKHKCLPVTVVTVVWVYIICVWLNTVLPAHVNTLVYVWQQRSWQQTGRKQFAFVCVCASLCVCGVCACSPCKHTGLCLTAAAMTTNKKKTICICLCVCGVCVQPMKMLLSYIPTYILAI